MYRRKRRTGGSKVQTPDRKEGGKDAVGKRHDGPRTEEQEKGTQWAGTRRGKDTKDPGRTSRREQKGSEGVGRKRQKEMDRHGSGRTNGWPGKGVIGELDRLQTALGQEQTSGGGHPGVALSDTGRDGCPDS